MSEQDKAKWWQIGWEMRTFSMGSREQTRILRRVTWARHRRERAERAEFAGQQRCWYCERPGHSDDPCPVRRDDAEQWAAVSEEAHRRMSEPVGEWAIDCHGEEGAQ